MHATLGQLGEEHWQKGNKQGAKELYEFSLNFLEDHESSVFNTLFRLAYFEEQEITETSTNEQMLTALNAKRDMLLRFFDFFPESKSRFAHQAYSFAAFGYFNKFPQLLTYDNYNAEAYNNAVTMISASGNIPSAINAQVRYDRMISWNLVQSKVIFKNTANDLLSGDLSVSNTSITPNFPHDEYTDERTFSIDAASTETPVSFYGGHSYKFEVALNASDSTSVPFVISGLSVIPGKRFIYIDNGSVQTEDLDDPTAPTEIVFMTGFIDSDNDGLSDDEELQLGTDKLAADSDSDNLTDFFEVRLSKTNPLSPDTNDDGTTDDLEDPDADSMTNVEEQTTLFDPLNPAKTDKPYRYEQTVVEDAEDGDILPWSFEVAQSAVENILDEVESNNFISITGTALIPFPSQVLDITKVQWRHKTDQPFKISFRCTTDKGQRTLVYTDSENTEETTEQNVFIPLHKPASSNAWFSQMRDLQIDLHIAQPETTISSIDAMSVTGSVSIDDITLVNYVDADHDLIPDELELSLGLNPADPTDAELDLDNDGLTNREEMNLTTDISLRDTDGDTIPDGDEVELGLNPKDSSDAASIFQPALEVTGLEPGIVGSYYKGDWTTIPDFTELIHYGTHLTDTINYPESYGAFAASNRGDKVGALYKGYIEIPADAYYTFYLTCDEGARLYIDDVLVVDNGGRHAIEEKSAGIGLMAGKHSVTVEYYERTGYAALMLEWDSTVLNERTIIPAGTLYHDPTYYQFMADSSDTDGDGLTDIREIELGTDPNKADTDNDGLTDYYEVEKYATDPLDKDTDDDSYDDYTEVMIFYTDATKNTFGDKIDLFTMNAAMFSNSIGEWQKDSGELYSKSRRGFLEYTFNIGFDDVYTLTLQGRDNSSTPQTSSFKFYLYVDGEYIFNHSFTANNTEYSSITFMLPPLKKGEHTVRIFWDNAAEYKQLRLKDFTISAIDGPDSDGNGIKDWVEERTNAMCSVELPSGSKIDAESLTFSSKVSPACLEGRGHYLGLMSTSDPAVTINNCAGHRWYTNVDLDPSATKQFDISFQNEAKVVNTSIHWTPTHLPEETEPQSIRINDSLRLSGLPDGVNGSANFTITNSAGETLASHIQSLETETLTYTFATQDTYTVTGSYTDETGTHEFISTINVIDYTLCDTFKACLVNRPRALDFAKAPEAIVIEADHRLTKFQPAAEQSETNTIYDVNMDKEEARYVVARIGENGPIVSSMKLQGMRVYGAKETALTTIETYEDGTILGRFTFVCQPVVPGVELRTHIFLTGVTFDDGTTDVTTTAADFNELGERTLRVIKTPAAPKTAACHTTYVYQNDEFISTVY